MVGGINVDKEGCHECCGASKSQDEVIEQSFKAAHCVKICHRSLPGLSLLGRSDMQCKTTVQTIVYTGRFVYTTNEKT
jgi:hypothetical protein